MTETIAASTRVLALLGDPVAHSLSPAFQNAALRHCALDAVYQARRCSATELPAVLREIARAGGGGNVTIPHKELAATVVERRTDAVERTAACNTFWLEDGAIHGDNTDVAGFVAAARELVRGLAGAEVLLLGAGGAAAAALVGLLDEGSAAVSVLNRSRERAESLVTRIPSSATALSIATDPAELEGARFDLVVNATPLGLRAGDPLPLPRDGGFHFDAALDLVYAPSETPWVHALRGQGVRAADGLTMLLHQGAAAFERWWGIPAPIAAMRAALPRRPDP